MLLTLHLLSHLPVVHQLYHLDVIVILLHRLLTPSVLASFVVLAANVKIALSPKEMASLRVQTKFLILPLCSSLIQQSQ